MRTTDPISIPIPLLSGHITFSIWPAPRQTSVSPLARFLQPIPRLHILVHRILAIYSKYTHTRSVPLGVPGKPIGRGLSPRARRTHRTKALASTVICSASTIVLSSVVVRYQSVCMVDRQRREACADVQRRSRRDVDCSRTWATIFTKEAQGEHVC